MKIFIYQKNRASQDRQVNNNGYKLLELCKNNNLFIANGRIGRDKLVGRHSFRNVSVIDYTIASASLFKLLANFEIVEVDSLFSDGHCMLCTSLRTSAFSERETNVNTELKNDRQIPRWDERYSDSFRSFINTDSINDILRLLSENAHNKVIVNQAIDILGNIFQEARKKAFPRKRSNFRDTNYHTKNKPWFGPQCKTARKKYHLAKKKI